MSEIGTETCPHCGGSMEGDGFTIVRHCENVDLPLDVEPDANPIFCDHDQEQAREAMIAEWEENEQVSLADFEKEMYFPRREALDAVGQCPAGPVRRIADIYAINTGAGWAKQQAHQNGVGHD